MARLERAVSLAEHVGLVPGPCALMICGKATGGSLLLRLPAELRASTVILSSR